MDKSNVTPGTERSATGRKKCKEYCLDYAKLALDLERQLESDKTYWIQNEAKIRAVNTVGTYEDFRQIVLAAHLRPLDKRDKDNLGPGAAMNSKVVWNSVAVGDRGNSDDCCAKTQLEIGKSLKVPKGIDEFVQVWKELGNDDTGKAAYLRQLTGEEQDCALEKVFGFEVPVDMLPSILEVLTQVVQDLDTARFSLKVLQIMSQSQRFPVTRIFFTTEERQKLTKVFRSVTEIFAKYDEEGKCTGKSEMEKDAAKMLKELTDLLTTVKSQYSDLIN